MHAPSGVEEVVVVVVMVVAMLLLLLLAVAAAVVPMRMAAMQAPPLAVVPLQRSHYRAEAEGGEGGADGRTIRLVPVPLIVR